MCVPVLQCMCEENWQPCTPCSEQVVLVMVSFSVSFGGALAKPRLEYFSQGLMQICVECRCIALQGVSESHLKLLLCGGCKAAR